VIKSCLTLACMLAMSGLTYKIGEINAYTLQNDNFRCSFYITDDHSSINLSTTSYLEGYSDFLKGFNVNIALLQNGEATVQYIDPENNLYRTSLKSIIECANEFEKRNQ